MHTVLQNYSSNISGKCKIVHFDVYLDNKNLKDRSENKLFTLKV